MAGVRIVNEVEENDRETKIFNKTKIILSIPIAESKKTRDLLSEHCIVDDAMPDILQDLCLENLYHKENTTYRYFKHATFFQKNLIHVLTEAAEHILWGRADEIIALVKKNPTLLNFSIEAKDPLGRRVKGTLLQIAIAAGDVNIKETKDEKEQGIVERLSSLMSKEEFDKQFSAWFPAGWKNINNNRMQRYLTALEEFAENIINADIPNLKWCSLQQLKDAQEKSQPFIAQLRKALEANCNEIVTCGFILDAKIFYKACKLFEDKRKRFGGWWRLKSDIFWLNGFGSLQGIASARDAHVISKGIGAVVNDNKMPERIFKNSDGNSCFFVISSRLGLDFYLGNFGQPLTLGLAGGVACASPGLCTVKNYIISKTTSLAKLMRQEENMLKQSICVIL